MKLCIGVLVFVLAVFAMADKPRFDIYKNRELFEKYVVDYKKIYKDDLDRQDHYNAFVASLVDINRLSKKFPSQTFDVNSFADYTPREWDLMNGYRPSPKKKDSYK